MVRASTKNEVRLCPHNFGVNLETGIANAHRYLTCVDPGMPNVRDIAGEEGMSGTPIHAVIVCDFSGLDRRCEPGFFSPHGIQRNSVGGVAVHEYRP
jgi:hypothetical protein